MKNILKFVQSLLPRIDRKNVDSELDRLRTDLRDHTLPPYLSTLEFMKGWRFKDKWLTDFDKGFIRQVDSRFKGNSLEVIYEVLNRTLDNLTTLERLVKNEYAGDIMRSAMSYSEANLLRIIEGIDFASRYSRLFLIHALGTETSLYRGNRGRSYELSKAQEDWLVSEARLFFDVMRALDHTPRELEKIFKEIPDLNVDEENADNVAAVTGRSKLEPFYMGASATPLSPIYHIRIAIADWQVARYDAAKEEKKMLEFQILDLKAAMEDKHNARLEQQLEYTVDRVNKLNYRIKRMEEA